MAYFSNGTEGMVFDEQCLDCLHIDPDIGCPIALVQLNFNYDQVGNKKLEEAMDCLIDKDGKCQMKPLIDKYLPKDVQLKIFHG